MHSTPSWLLQWITGQASYYQMAPEIESDDDWLDFSQS
jgi:hypothetical protein